MRGAGRVKIVEILKLKFLRALGQQKGFSFYFIDAYSGYGEKSLFLILKTQQNGWLMRQVQYSGIFL